MGLLFCVCACGIKLRMGKRKGGLGFGQRNHAFITFKELTDFVENIFIAVHGLVDLKSINF